MPVSSAKKFNLPWHQHECYWISLHSQNTEFPAVLKQLGMEPKNAHTMAIKTTSDWKSVWTPIYKALETAGLHTQIEASLSPGTEDYNTAPRQLPAAIQTIADSLWLGEALIEGRILCYLQPLVSARDKVFGYESFARLKMPDGEVIGGAQIIAAAKSLGIEHMIDRHLHVQAINTFVSSQFDGFLFVNFLPGFIHRPDVYLEGLSETVKNYKVISKHIVLEFTKSETPRDLQHMKSICDYARSKGYSVALDDIESVESARKLVSKVRPDFVKIDMQLIRSATEKNKSRTIHDIVELVHAHGGSVVAEGVETEEIYQHLKTLKVDLFQGFLFSPPVPVEAALKKNTA